MNGLKSILALLASRKAWVTIFGIISTVAGSKFGLNDSQVFLVAGLCAVLILSIMGEDVAKHIKITLPDEKGPRELSGRLVDTQEEGIELETATGREQITFADVLNACVLPEIKSFPRESKKR